MYEVAFACSIIAPLSLFHRLITIICVFFQRVSMNNTVIRLCASRWKCMISCLTPARNYCDYGVHIQIIIINHQRSLCNIHCVSFLETYILFCPFCFFPRYAQVILIFLILGKKAFSFYYKKRRMSLSGSLVFLFALHAASSVSLTLLNKALTLALPLPFHILILQNSFSVALTFLFAKMNVIALIFILMFGLKLSFVVL